MKVSRANLLIGFCLGTAFACAVIWFYQQQFFTQEQTPATASTNVNVLPPMHMDALKRERQLRIYLPKNYQQSHDRYPVLYMHDAQNLFDAATAYAGEWGIDEALNTLAQTHNLNLIVVGIDNGGDKRITELNPFDHERFGAAEGDAYLAFIVNQVKPWIDSHYRTLADRDNTAIMGSSMGGLISHYATIKHADIFSKAGIFSPAYWTAKDFSLYIQNHPSTLAQRSFFLMGEKEGGSMMSDFNEMEKVVEQMQQQNSLSQSVFITVENAQHNEAFWRQQFIPAVLWLFKPEA